MHNCRINPIAIDSTHVQKNGKRAERRKLRRLIAFIGRRRHCSKKLNIDFYGYLTFTKSFFNSQIYERRNLKADIHFHRLEAALCLSHVAEKYKHL